MKNFICKIGIVIIALALFGCAKLQTTYTKANAAIDKTQSQVAQAKINNERVAPVVVTKGDYYSDTKPLTLEEQAYWLKNRISVNGRALPFSFLVSRILRNVNVAVHYDSSVKKSQLVTMNYEGTIHGALNDLSDKTGYAYQLTDEGVVWSDLITKTFNISFMPGTSTYLVGGATSIGTGASGGSSSGTSGGTTSSSSSGVSDSQYSTLQGTLSVWDDLKNTLEQLKSKDGKVYVAQSTTSVTVTDHPSNVAEIERYISDLNHNMSKQVRLHVQVLEMQLDNSHAYGVDWNLVRSMLNTHIALTSGLGSAAAIGKLTSANSMQLKIGESSSAIIQALSSQGKVSVVTEPSATTMNNQVAAIRIAKDTSYLQSVSQTNSENYVTTTMTPGTVTEGFTLYLVPKIQDSQIYLQVSSTLSTLDSLDSVTSAPSTTKSSAASGQTSQQIQVPTLSQKHFNMKSLLDNNETLVIGGFKQTRNETKETKPFGLKILGGQGAQIKNIETILLITPTLIENKY